MGKAPRNRAVIRRAELVLLSIGLLCAGYSIFVGIQALAARRSAAHIEEPAHATQAADIRPASPHSASPVVIGRLDIPKLALSVPIISGYGSSSLLRGVGHIPGTAFPGGLGTVGLAGHRDTYFRPLRRIAPGMEIRLTGKSGVYHYEVDSTEIVKPEQVSVLKIESRPALTLITCYPFVFIGHAPRRFIVHAHLLSAAPDATKP